MIQVQSKIKIKDNTGIKEGNCIKVLKKKNATIGDLILISIRNLKLNSLKKNKFYKGDIVKCLIIQTKFSNKSVIGNYIKFKDNAAIVLNNQNKPLGTKIFGLITSEFRKNKQFKILSLSSNIL
jgi:large subunit ribosomal protein L14